MQIYIKGGIKKKLKTIRRDGMARVKVPSHTHWEYSHAKRKI